MSSFQEIAHKKIAGVPVLYLAGGTAAVLAVVAWRMKPSPDASPEESPSDGGTDAQLDENGQAVPGNPYAGMSSNGTVTVVQQPAVTEAEPDTIDTNDEWVREGAEWLVANKNVPGPSAHAALTKFVEGRSRSITEGQWVEWVIKEKGFPPDPFSETPEAASTPAAPAAPVKPTGYRGYGWAKADGKTTGAQYAAKYKIPVTQFYSWNSGQPRTPKKGAWLKVRASSNPLTGYKGV